MANETTTQINCIGFKIKDYFYICPINSERKFEFKNSRPVTVSFEIEDTQIILLHKRGTQATLGKIIDCSDHPIIEIIKTQEFDIAINRLIQDLINREVIQV